MRGAILGDIIGSAYEGRVMEPPCEEFNLFSNRCGFTDDTVMTVAVMDALMRGVGELGKEDARKFYAGTYHAFGNRYRHAGYGGFFREWLDGDGASVGTSFGNGAIMRVSPVAWFFDDLDTVERQAEHTTLGTHEHEESRRAAKAVATTILLARKHSGKSTRDDLCRRVERVYGYDLTKSLDEIRSERRFNVTCMGTVPLVFAAFLECDGVEDAVRKAVRMGGDTDTNACIAASLAEGWFGCVPDDLWKQASRYLDMPLTKAVERFTKRVME